MIKRQFILFILCLTTSCAFALTPVKLALDWYINPNHAPILIGIQKGYFKQHGLDVQLVTPTQSSEPAQLLSAGKVTFAIDYEPNLIEQIAAGMPIHWIASLVNQPLSCITVLSSSGITSLHQLKGKAIGGDTNPANSVTMRKMLATQGVKLSQITFIQVNMNLIQALLSHRVDAVTGMSRNIEPVQLAMMGIKTHLFLPQNNGVPNYSEYVIVTKNGTSQKTIHAFRQALTQSILDVKQHPLQDWRLVSQAYHTQLAMTPKMAKTNKAIWLATVKYFDLDPSKLNTQTYNKFENFLHQEGVIHKSVSFSLYTSGI